MSAIRLGPANLVVDVVTGARRKSLATSDTAPFMCVQIPTVNLSGQTEFTLDTGDSCFWYSISKKVDSQVVEVLSLADPRAASVRHGETHSDISKSGLPVACVQIPSLRDRQNLHTVHARKNFQTTLVPSYPLTDPEEAPSSSSSSSASHTDHAVIVGGMVKIKIDSSAPHAVGDREASSSSGCLQMSVPPSHQTESSAPLPPDTHDQKPGSCVSSGAGEGLHTEERGEGGTEEEEEKEKGREA
uniref:Uncharacterized protein n=1 Tax=Chromera velia CCMP2878 TaxID=1169474 RepID=A0A0G4FIR9_9ALVE|eukprot:Cvel_3382.t1-p1 / transcript=Cvel_3382.t1 / gene=Cvel_3382 / organism=Chromera_velia_CCMP2878 / gene_product=hypothetical protein / transcript_product=hypothetical protein / location=Cvel_scaffold136:31315-33991(+) / protein_length=243 / sequence_SO=supercontig / SO=protein_coding / is_pseudo=false